TTGTAVSLSNVGGTFSFHDISANGAVNGISLTSTTGSFTVTGNGNTSVGGDNSGGIIQNTTGAGISLTNAQNLSFTNLKIQNTVGSGIQGATNGAVSNFAFHNGTIDNSDTGAAVDGSNIAFNGVPNANETNLLGVVSITNSVLTNSHYHGVDIQEFGGTITSLDISGNTFTSSTLGTSSLGSAIRVGIRGTASAAGNLNGATIANNTISNFPSGAGILV